jgi:hypothetical protein
MARPGLKDLPDDLDQAHAGAAAPFNFNGLVRHSYLEGPEQGDLQINLRPKASAAPATPSPSTCANAWRTPRRQVVKIVEVPPGPPVPAKLLAGISD